MSKKPLEAALQDQLNKLASLPDDQIDTVDTHETSPEAWLHARRPGFYKPVKKPVTLRLAADVVAGCISYTLFWIRVVVPLMRCSRVSDLCFTSPSLSRSLLGSTPMTEPGLRITRKVENTRPRSIACFVSISRKLAPDRFQSALFLRLQGEAKSMLEMPIADGRRRRSGSRRYRAGSGSRRYAARPPRDRRRLGPAPDRARRSAPSGFRRRSCQRGRGWR